MTWTVLSGPFGNELLEEVPLPSSPLARVLAQVRFPRLSALVGGDEVANAFAAVLRADYPLLNEEREMAVAIGPGGPTPIAASGRTWQLRSADQRWRVSFGDTFLAIDTEAYVSRSDFSVRLESAWARFVEVASPPFVERVGVRYINQITDPTVLAAVPTLVRPEAVGGLDVPLGTARLRHSVSASLFDLNPLEGLQVQVGALPPGAVFDRTLPAVDTVSWILDLDSYRLGQGSVDPAGVASQIQDLAGRAYRYFRWITRPEFLVQFGGEPA